MTATEELRRLLDERGVEWDNLSFENDTWWHDANDVGWYAGGIGRRVKIEATLTPEQAIEASLGRGECKSTSKYVNEFTCSACGFEYDFISDPYQGPNYCPNCGKRVREGK